MKKGNNNLKLVKYTSLNCDNRKEDHFSYFQNLEQKLLNESEKLATLISVINPASETKSLPNSLINSSSTTKAKLIKGKNH